MPRLERTPRQRIGRGEIYPKAGEPTEPVRALIPTFGKEIVEGLIKGVQNGQLRFASLELQHVGSQPQTLRVELENPGGANDLRITLSGDWTRGPEVIEGTPLVATFDGRFFRKMRPEDQKPIAEEGDTLDPDAPIGVGMMGKQNKWLLRLPREKFPKGGRVTKYPHPDGTEVVAGETILCFVQAIT